jgi:hypothetical protein
MRKLGSNWYQRTGRSIEPGAPHENTIYKVAGTVRRSEQDTSRFQIASTREKSRILARTNLLFIRTLVE